MVIAHLPRCARRRPSRGRGPRAETRPYTDVGMLRLLQAHVFPRRCEVELRAQADPGLLDPRADAVQGSRLEDAAVHDALVHQVLDLMQERLALLAVPLLGLLPEQIVDVRVAAGGVRRAADDEV